MATGPEKTCPMPGCVITAWDVGHCGLRMGDSVGAAVPGVGEGRAVGKGRLVGVKVGVTSGTGSVGVVVGVPKFATTTTGVGVDWSAVSCGSTALNTTVLSR